jgi:uncharacterized protein YggE
MNPMQRPCSALVAIPLAASLLACAPSVHAASPEPGVVPDTGVVRVSGSASVSVAADRAHLRFAVETRAPEATDAATANARAMDAVIAAVRGQLGDRGELSTEGYSLVPEYSRPQPGEPDARRVVAYRAVNHVAVTVAELDRVAPVLDAAVDAGANRVSQLSFVAGDTREARLEAIRRATAKATGEARVLAAELGGSLGPVLEVTVSPENQGGGPVMRMAMAESAGPATPLEPGSQRVEVTVTVSWRLDSGGR